MWGPGNVKGTPARLRAIGASSNEFKRGNTIRMPYWTIPTDAVDDPDLLAAWIKLAYAAGRRAAVKEGRGGGK